MKTLGFPGARVLRMVLGESTLLSGLGGGLGLGVAAFMLHGLSKSPMGASFGDLSMDLSVALVGIVLAILLGLVTGLIPALSALRMNIIDALGRR